MNVFVMVDIEGISGIYTKEQVLPTNSRFDEGRKFMTEDINACVKGLRAAGVDKIYVRDTHGGSYTLDWENATSDVDGYICGVHRDMRFLEIEDFDAVIFLGYHAMAGQEGAVLEHTYSSLNFENVFVNGEKAGEMLIDAAILGEKGKPVIMVSGDDKVCAEAKAIIPGIVTAEVKKALDIEGAVLLPKEKAHKLIYEKAIEAVKNFENVKPFKVKTPVELKVELVERRELPNSLGRPYIKILDGHTFTISGDTMEEALFRLLF